MSGPGWISNAPVVALLVSLLLASCAQAGDEVIVPDTTRVLDDATLAALSEVSPDLTTLTFGAITPQLEAMQAGDVLVTGIFGSMLPSGMLQRVVSVERSAGGIVLTTERAMLTDAIQRGSFAVERTYVEPMSASTSALGVARAALDDEEAVATFALDDIVLYDADGNELTTHDQILLDGSITFAPTFSFGIDIIGFAIDDASIAIGGELGAALALEVRQGGTFDERFALGTITFMPITFTIGPIPVVIVPTLNFFAGVEGDIAGAMTTSTAASTDMVVGFGLVDGDFEGFSDFDTSSVFDPPRFAQSAHATARGYGGVRFSLELYGVAGPYVSAEAYVRATVAPLVDPWWRLTAGLDVNLGFDFAGYAWDDSIFAPETLLDQAEGASPSSEIDTFSRTYGGMGREHVSALVALPEGGALVAGSASSFSTAPFDAYLLRVDRLGVPTWQRTYDNLGTFTAMARRESGEILVAAERLPGGSVNTATLLSLDANGAVRWARSVDGEQVEVREIIPTATGAYLGGIIGIGLARDFWVAQIDAEGELMWQSRLGGDEADHLHAMVLIDGELVVAGWTDSFGPNPDVWLARLSGTGAVRWQRAYVSPGNDRAYAMARLGDDLIVAGNRTLDALLMRIDGATGDLEWAKLHDTTGSVESCGDLVITNDDIIVCGGEIGLGGDDRGWLLGMDGNGDVIWSRTMGGVGDERFGAMPEYEGVGRALAIAADGAILIGGMTESSGAGGFDAWLIGATPNGVVQLGGDSGLDQAPLAGETTDAPIMAMPTTFASAAASLVSAPAAIESISVMSALGTVTSQGVEAGM